jgi:3-oxoacyl-[acyl-carrier protein] reductase/bacilysin biosynthesis oxidoreductase BacG
MELGLAGKTALITGGSAGIGLACAKTLVCEGVNVAIVSRSAERLAGAKAELEDLGIDVNVATIAADLTQAADVERAVTEARSALGQIDILINSAGSARGGKFFDLSDQGYLDAWNLKVLGYIRVTRAVARDMVERRDGRIVNIVGGAGRTPTAEFLTGSTANAALVNFTRGVSKALAPHNVRIVAISPGTTATGRTEGQMERDAQARGVSIDAVRADRVKNIPLGHMVDPGEIAAITALVVSDRMSSMTGCEILVDGGAAPGF